MGKTGRLVAVTAIMLLAHTLPALADSAEESSLPVEPRPSKFEFSSLEQFDTFIGFRKQLAWDIREESANFGPDIAGRTLAQNADEYIFTAQADTELLALRAKAGEQAAAGDQAGLATSLRAAKEFAYRTFILADLLGRWHSTSDMFSAQEAALRPLLEKSPEPERQKTRARIDPLLQEMRRLLAEAVAVKRVDDFPKASVGVRQTNDALFDAYNEERMRLAPFVAAWDSEHGIAPLSRIRSTPCNPPYPEPSTTGSATLEKSSVTQPDYPTDARRLGFAGTIQIRAEISETGCAKRVEIARSAGFQSLDAAALAWAEGLRFHPAQVDGRANAGSYTFAVTFKLSD
jgi:TonB family protein